MYMFKMFLFCPLREEKGREGKERGRRNKEFGINDTQREAIVSETSTVH